MPRQLLWILMSCSLISVCCCSLHVNSSETRRTTSFERTLTETATCDPGKSLTATGSNGNITIRRRDREDVSVTAIVSSHNLDRLAETSLDLETHATGGLTVTVNWPDGSQENGESCDLVVEIPVAAGITAKTTNGDITLSSLRGNAQLTTTNGDIMVDHHDGPLSIQTSNGIIEARSVTDSITANTTNSDVTIVLADPAKGPVNVATTNGNIDVSLNPGFRGNFKAFTTNGQVTWNPHDRRGRTIGRNKANISYGKGPQGTLTTTNGDIRIHP